MLPERIGRYAVERELGRGGMAVVYLARDPRSQRQVAVKMLPHQLTFDPSFRARFEREVQVAAGLVHPCIPPLLDFGEEAGQPFLVMPYLPGGSLHDRLENGPLRLEELAPVVARVAAALDHAHARQVIHRDLKPDNILFDLDGQAYLADFGMARLAESSSSLTGSSILGTPDYISPEQARGLAEIDGRSDVYTLGAVIFHALTGRRPYAAETVMGAVVAHLTQPPPNILAANPGLPPVCQALIDRAMAKDPAGRYPSAGELARDLERLARGQAPAAGGALVAMSQALGEQVVLESHPGEVTCLAFSRDSRLLLTGGDDKLLRLWDLAAGRVRRTFKGHAGMLTDAAVSPDGRWLASAGHGDTFARLWEAGTGRQAAALAHSSYVQALAFSSDGRWLVTGNNYGELCLWETASALGGGQAEGRLLADHRGYTAGLAFSPDGRYLAVAAGQVAGLHAELWDAREFRLLRSLQAEAQQAWDSLSAVAFSPDSQRLAAVARDVMVWRTAGGELERRLPGAGGLRGVAAFAPDNRTLAVAWFDATLRLLDVDSGEEIGRLDDSAGQVAAAHDLAFSPDGRWFALAGRDGQIRLWQLA